MAQSDYEKWERKYAERPELLSPRPPSALLVRHAGSGVGRRALDVACGTGRNALWLADNGWRVETADISPTALEILRSEAQRKGLETIRTLCVDLDRFTPERSYDLIVMTNYLDRTLLPRLIAALTPGGIAVVETYMKHPANEKTGNPDYLLDPGELPGYFGTGFEILEYGEYPNENWEIHRMYKAGIAARRFPAVL